MRIKKKIDINVRKILATENIDYVLVFIIIKKGFTRYNIERGKIKGLEISNPFTTPTVITLMPDAHK